MKHKWKNRRLEGYDYRQPGFYFVTINTYERVAYFGEIENGSENLSGIGELANYCWTQIPNHFENARIHEFIIMPDHIHGIIELVRTSRSVAGNAPTSANQTGSSEWFSSISPQSGSISTIIRSFKSAVTRIANLQFHEAQFSWQPRFYDHIIRNKAEYFRMANYIRNNPVKWTEEKGQSTMDLQS